MFEWCLMHRQVNPLAGCLPALIQIPIFISLYRALSNLAIEVIIRNMTPLVPPDVSFLVL